MYFITPYAYDKKKEISKPPAHAADPAKTDLTQLWAESDVLKRIVLH